MTATASATAANELTVGGKRWRVIAHRLAVGLEAGGFEWVDQPDMEIIPSHRLRVRNQIEKAMRDYPMFDLFGGDITVQFRWYIVAPVS
jgi:hypothetical protein